MFGVQNPFGRRKTAPFPLGGSIHANILLDDAINLNLAEIAHYFIRRATASCLWVAVREFVYQRTKLRSELVLSRGVAGVQMASENYDHESGVACASLTRGVVPLTLQKIARREVPCQPMVRSLAAGAKRIWMQGGCTK